MPIVTISIALRARSAEKQGSRQKTLTPQTRHLSVKVRVFIDFLVERFGGRPYWDLVE
jgi:hypothetical protein